MLHIPRLALSEAANGWKRELRRVLTSLGNAKATARKLDPSLEVSVPVIDQDEATRRLHEDLVDALKAAGVRMPKTPDVPHDALIERALSRRPPFDDKGGGYRDALLWEIVKQVAADGHEVVFVSGDEAFAHERKYGEPLADVLADEVSESGSVALTPNVEAAIAMLELARSEAFDQAQQILAALGPDFPEELASRLVKRLTGRVHGWQARAVVSLFVDEGASLGVAYRAETLDLEEARVLEDGRVETSVTLTVRQFVSVFVPIAFVSQIGTYETVRFPDDDTASVEFDARVVPPVPSCARPPGQRGGQRRAG